MKSLKQIMIEVCRGVKRQPEHACEHCHGTGKTRTLLPGGGWDRFYEDTKCDFCTDGKIGGSQPGLHLWFHSIEERDSFKAKLLQTGSIKWVDESEDTLEAVNAEGSDPENKTYLLGEIACPTT